MKHPFLLALLFSFSTLLNAQPEENTVRTITTEGTSTVYAQPDEILLSFDILSVGDDLSQLREENRKKSVDVLNYLKETGIEARHIQTKYMHIGNRYGRHKDGLGKYEARQRFDVCVKDLTKYEDILSGLLGQGVSNINGPNFRSTEMRAHKDEARKKAIVAAREKAEMLAKELGQTIGPAIHINEVNTPTWGGNQNAYSNTVVDTGGSGGGEGFALGQMQFKATITVTFELK